MEYCCQECGYRFPTIDEAREAFSSDEGCPVCGSTDVDLCGD